MKLLEMRVYIEIDETQTDAEDIKQTLENDFNFLTDCEVKRVDLIDVIDR